MKNLDYVAPAVDGNCWAVRHRAQVARALAGRAEGPGIAVVRGINVWCEYAATHQQQFGSPIGEDYVLGPAWARWGWALRALLNGELGPLDAGTLDAIVSGNLDEQGFTEDKRPD